MADDTVTDVFVLTKQPDNIIICVARSLPVAMQKALEQLKKPSDPNKDVSEQYFLPIDGGEHLWELHEGHGSLRTRRATIVKTPLV